MARASDSRLCGHSRVRERDLKPLCDNKINVSVVVVVVQTMLQFRLIKTDE